MRQKKVKGSKNPASKPNIKKLITNMTVEEKVKLLHGKGMDVAVNLGAIDNGRVPGAGGETYEFPQYDIPSIVLCDGPAGLRIKPNRGGKSKEYLTTIYPSGTALASSWNTKLMSKVGQAMGEEAKEYGIDVFLAPGINIQRNPLNGRNFEYMSEDPVLSGLIAASLIKGVQSKGVGTSLKHYAANNQETNRLYSNSLVSERAMREIYLKGFEIAVKESQPWTIMTSYNKLNGRYTNERKDLNTQILRNEWKFTGLVMTDWFAGFPTIEAVLDTENTNDVGAEVSSGNDLIMPGSKQQIKQLVADVSSGKVTMEELDTSVERVLRVIFKTPAGKGHKYRDNPDLPKYAKLSREAAAEGIVLLKNNNTLPLDIQYSRLALFGVDSYNLIIGGSGSSDVYRLFNNPFSEGLEKQGAILDCDLKYLYLPYVNQKLAEDKARRDASTPLELYANIPQIEISDELIAHAAQKNEVALFTIGRNSGETYDLSEEKDFNLLQEELSLLKRVSKAFRAVNKKVVVILNVGTAIETASWKDLADAILVSWFTGQYGGDAMADVLGGKVNPSAKLTQSFPMKYADVPSAKVFTGLPHDNPTDFQYTEGIYVGYRYYDSFNVPTSYPFGYGLSYTQFSYNGLQLKGSIVDDGVKISVMISNTGSVSGAEVVQVYVNNPKGVDRPDKELKAFTKTKVLEPESSEIVELKLNIKDFAYFDTKKSAWVVEKGEYMVLIGKSSQQIELKAPVTIPKTIVVEKVKPAFTEKLPFADLTRK